MEGVCKPLLWVLSSKAFAANRAFNSGMTYAIDDSMVYTVFIQLVQTTNYVLTRL